MSGVIISTGDGHRRAIQAHLLGGFPSVWSCEANGHLVTETSPNAGTIDSVILEKISRFSEGQH